MLARNQQYSLHGPSVSEEGPESFTTWTWGGERDRLHAVEVRDGAEAAEADSSREKCPAGNGESSFRTSGANLIKLLRP